ncbi:MAG TPA: hypothetical protein PLJ38_10785, partial [bacterium]|nr:hypothetical protein [bacterium]
MSKNKDTFKLVRGRFVIPISDKLGRNKVIEDGYVLIKNDKIFKVGKYTDVIGKSIIEKYSGVLEIIGCSKKSNFTTKDIIKHNCAILPGFVKAHGHDHESPIIGIAKDVPLTPWLDKAV